jgi:hypothetical protein
VDFGGAIYTVMNPAQAVREIEMPPLSRAQPPLANGRIIFRDAGFVPILRGNRIKLGPGQMAAVGFGRYAAQDSDLGVQDDVHIPLSIAPLDATFSPSGDNTIEATIPPPAAGDLRIIFQQRGSDGSIMRSWPGGPPNGATVGKVLKISAEQNGKQLPVEIDYDKQVWSGLSWGAGEIRRRELASTGSVLIRCSSAEKGKVMLEGHLYVVQY